MFKYWRTVLGRAGHETWTLVAGHGVASASVYLGYVLLASVIKWRFSGWQAGSDELVDLAIVLSSGTLLFIPLFLLNVLRTPAILDRERTDRLVQMEEDQRRKVLAPPITHRDWEELAKKFEQVPASLRAGWKSATRGQPDHWTSLSGESRDATEACESLCRMAGKMLLRSQRVSMSLSQKIRAVADPRDRWLDFIVSRRSLTDLWEASETDADGTTHDFVLGDLKQIGPASVAACLHCSSVEL